MKIDILTLFPEMFINIINQSILARAQKKGLVDIKVHNLRDWALDKHKIVDDNPYGGGAGMILKVDVIDRALHDIKSKTKNLKSKIILLTPQGKIFNQQKAIKLSKEPWLILICGHYGGFDERVRKLVDIEISLGNFVLTGGEIPTMAIIDAICRNIPDVIKPESLLDETHSQIGKIQYPQYTRPERFSPISIKTKQSLIVPKVLLSGNHAEILKWRKNNAK